MASVIEFSLNGARVRIDADPERTLLSVLRDELDVTGSKYGCGEGACGACMVLLDGEPVPACTLQAGSAVGREIVTIEGIARDGRLHLLQEAFIEHGAMQCGFCTPGMIVGGVAFLRRNPNPSDDDIAVGMRRHLCRCGVYPRIVRAIRAAADAAREIGSSGVAR